MKTSLLALISMEEGFPVLTRSPTNIRAKSPKLSEAVVRVILVVFEAKTKGHWFPHALKSIRATVVNPLHFVSDFPVVVGVRVDQHLPRTPLLYFSSPFLGMVGFSCLLFAVYVHVSNRFYKSLTLFILLILTIQQVPGWHNLWSYR